MINFFLRSSVQPLVTKGPLSNIEMISRSFFLLTSPCRRTHWNANSKVQRSPPQSSPRNHIRKPTQMKPQEILGTRASTVRPPNQQPHLSSSGETWIPAQVSPTSKPAHEETNRNHSKKHRPGRRSSPGSTAASHTETTRIRCHPQRRTCHRCRGTKHRQIRGEGPLQTQRRNLFAFVAAPSPPSLSAPLSPPPAETLAPPPTPGTSGP